MRTLSFDFHGGSHQLALPDGEIYRVIAKEILNGESYPLYATNPHPVRSVVDLGAHVGEWTLMAAINWPAAAVHAFEPNPQVLPLLRQNCQPYSNVVIHEQAAGPASERGTLFINNRNSVQAMMPRPEATEPGVEWSQVEIDVVGPETILALAPDVLKIDIEGMEGLVLHALGVGLARIGTVYVEYHLEQLRREIVALLGPSHELRYDRVANAEQGLLMYVKR